MRILFTAVAFPFPPRKGVQLRNGNFLKALAAEGHEITLVAFEAEENDLAEAKRYCTDVIVVPSAVDSRALAPLKRLYAVARRTPYGAMRMRSPEFEAAIKRELERRSYDFVLCDGPFIWTNLPEVSAPHLPGVGKCGGVPIVLSKDDLIYEIFERFAAQEKNALKRLYALLETRTVRRFERAVCGAADVVFACCEREAAVLREFAPRTPVLLAPNVVEVPPVPPPAQDDGRTALFVGALDWYPNEDAARYFAREILPPLRAAVPQVRFAVAGRSASDAVRKFFVANGVDYVGEVADMRAEMVRATVCVVPLRIGSGTRMKIIEAASLGRPIVATSIGGEGLTFVPGKEIAIADAPAEFAAAAARLLQSPEERLAMGAAAHRRAASEYSIGALQQLMRAALLSVAGAGAATAGSGGR